jgi:hypothetical protein
MSNTGMSNGSGTLTATMTGTLTTPSVANGAGVLSLDGGRRGDGEVMSNAGGALTLSTGAATTVTSLASTAGSVTLTLGGTSVIGPVTQQAGSLKATVAGDLTLGALTVNGGTSAIGSGQGDAGDGDQRRGHDADDRCSGEQAGTSAMRRQARAEHGWGADDDEPEQCLGQRRRDGGW